MIHSKDLDFSYSGLKTAVLYKLRSMVTVTENDKEEIAHAFEDAAIEVLIKKTETAINTYGIQTLIVGGGVSANTYLRACLATLAEERDDLTLLLPEPSLSTDNAIMIGLASYIEILLHPELTEEGKRKRLRANGNLSL